MKYKEFYEMQMERVGYMNPVEQDTELFSKLGARRYNKLTQAGFNIAYSERNLNLPPLQGSYQRDMLYNQNMINNLVYKRMVTENWDLNWYDSFIEEFSEDSCMETFRQAVAYKRLDDIIRDNGSTMNVQLLEDEN